VWEPLGGEPEGQAQPEYFRPVALWNAGATIFSFRYKREAA